MRLVEELQKILAPDVPYVPIWGMAEAIGIRGIRPEDPELS
jgi:hypothetical protein